MKKTKLFSLMAVAALMTACSSDDALNKENLLSSVDLSDRVEIGKLELNAGVESRGTLQDGSAFKQTWKPGEAIGAVLIDQVKDAALVTDTKVLGKADGNQSWNNTKTDWDYKNDKETVPYSAYVHDGIKVKNPQTYYQVTDNKIWTNYEYVNKTAGVFESEATLVEGNYLFYSPFNGDIQTREALDVIFPLVQDCGDTDASALLDDVTYCGSKVTASSKALKDLYEGTTKDYEMAISALGYSFLKKAASGKKIKATATMNLMYASPVITITNNFNGVLVNGESDKEVITPYSGEIEIEKVLIYHADPEDLTIFKSAKLQNTGVSGKLSNWTMDKVLAGNSDCFTEKVLQDRKTVGNKISDTFDWAVAKPSGYDAAKNYITCNINKKLAQGKSYHFHAAIPSANYGKNLRALVCVKIGGKRYVISEAADIQRFSTDNNTLIFAEGGKTLTPHTFSDVLHGDQNVILLRGQNVPAAELKVVEGADVATKKAFAGTMMTINLQGAASVPAAGSTDSKRVIAAYECATKKDDPDDKGLKTFAEFETYISDYVQRGVQLTENVTKVDVENALRTKDMNAWSAVKQFALHTSDCNIKIDGDLVNAMNRWLKLSNASNQYITFKTALPIESTVTVYGEKACKAPADNKFTFTATTGDKKSYEIKFVNTTKGELNGTSETGVATKNPADDVDGSNKLAQGLSVIKTATDKTINGAKGGAVVFLDVPSTFDAEKGAKPVITIKDATNIREIHATKDVVLKVECSLANTRVNACGTTIEITSTGDLKNSGNKFDGCTIKNESLKTIAGTMNAKLDNDNTASTVTITRAGWVTEEIPATAKVTQITISPNENTALQIDAEQVALLNKLSDVSIYLTKKVTGIKSSTNVTLSNIKLINASSAIKWQSSNVPLTVKGKASGDNNRTTLTNISADDKVTFDKYDADTNPNGTIE